MELRVEALSGSSIPNGCFIGVRVGEVLKQGRYDPSCCYRFPALERQRNAKIDLYQHLGTCSALVDPEAKANNEVKVSGLADIRLKISTRPDASKPREERKTEVKKQAKDYLGRHRIEERLCTAVKALLASQPEDPTEFLVTHLRESCEKAPPVEPVVQSGQPTTDAEDPELAQAAVKIQAVQRGKKERHAVEQIRREKEEGIEAPSAAPAGQSGQPTSDAEDPELAQAAVRIQAVQRGKKERQELQQIRREKEEAVEAKTAAPTEQSDQPTTDAEDPELALAAVKIQAVQRGKKERQELQQIRREKEDAVATAAAGRPPPDGTGAVLEDNRFQAYYSKNIGPQMTPNSWNALHAMFVVAS